MDDENLHSHEPGSSSKKKKSERKEVFTIIEKPGKRPHWMKIGIAFINRDSSWNVYLDALPLGGKLQLRDEDLRPANSQSATSPSPERPLPSFDLEAIQ